MPVRVLGIEAPPAIVAVDLIAAMACRIGPIGQAARLDPVKDAVELGFADQKGVVLGRDLGLFGFRWRRAQGGFAGGPSDRDELLANRVLGRRDGIRVGRLFPAALRVRRLLLRTAKRNGERRVRLRLERALGVGLRRESTDLVLDASRRGSDLREFHPGGGAVLWPGSSPGSVCSLSATNQLRGHFGNTEPAGAGTESDGATGARATGEIGSSCDVRNTDAVDAMRFSYAEALCDPTHYLPLARAVEDAGWDTFIVPDSICYPEVSDSKYPYTPDGNREFLEDKPFIEPFSLIPAMAAVTRRLRFTTFVVKLPIRQPVLVAKSVASVAVMTQGRFGFGVGLSPWPEDFVVTGDRLDDARQAHGRDDRDRPRSAARRVLRVRRHALRVPSIKICPVPSAPVPVLIGGHTEPALRRAARLGDGWMHAGRRSRSARRLPAGD